MEPPKTQLGSSQQFLSIFIYFPFPGAHLHLFHLFHLLVDRLIFRLVGANRIKLETCDLISDCH